MSGSEVESEDIHKSTTQLLSELSSPVGVEEVESRHPVGRLVLGNSTRSAVRLSQLITSNLEIEI